MLLTIFLISFAILILISNIWFKRNFNYWLQYPEIPSTSGKIFSGKFLDMLTFRINFGCHLKNIYEDKNFENAAVVGLFGLHKPGLLIRAPEIIKSILIKDFECFHNRSGRGDDQNDHIGTLGLFFSTYNGWKEMRQKLNTAFSSGKMKFMYPLLEKVGDRLEFYLQQKGERFTLELKQTCGQYTTEVISTTLMGFKSNALENQNDRVYQEAVKLSLFNLKRAFDFLIIFFAPKFNRLLRPKVFYSSTEEFIRSSLQCLMEERERSHSSRPDLVQVFLKIKHEAKQTNENLEKCQDNFVGQSCLFMLGGYETSATTLANALFELAKDFQIQNKLRNEILYNLEAEKGELSYESLNKMTYLQMVIDEVLRLYPVLPFLDREFIKPSNRTIDFSMKPFNDYKLPSGMPIYISVFGLHYDAKYWKNPTKFDPERFSPGNKKLLHPMTYLPFGGGPRSCIGSRLAMLEIKVGLIRFLKNHYVQVCAKTVMNPTFDGKSILLQNEGGVHLEFIRDNMYEKN